MLTLQLTLKMVSTLAATKWLLGVHPFAGCEDHVRGMRSQAQNLCVVADWDLHVVAARLKHENKPEATVGMKLATSPKRVEMNSKEI